MCGSLAGRFNLPLLCWPTGDPAGVGRTGGVRQCDAAYGTNTVISEIAFVASAPESVDARQGARMACSGWTGEGDVPAVGASNRVSLSLSGPSALVWQWRGEVAFTNRYRLADVNAIFGETVRWVPEGASAETETALELGFVGNVPYAFCGWRVDGTRWPDADSTSPNPATGIVMYAPRLAEGDYLPFWLDSDDNVLSDWWELRYFGSATGGRDNQDDSGQRRVGPTSASFSTTRTRAMRRASRLRLRSRFSHSRRCSATVRHGACGPRSPTI